MIEHEVGNEGHRAACVECSAVWFDLERISAEARALPALAPSRDLWAGIEARLAGAGAQAVAPTTLETLATPGAVRGARRLLGVPALRLATAATLLVAATASLTWWVAGRAPGSAGPIAAQNALPSLDPDGLNAINGTPVSLASEFGPLDREIASLEEILSTERDRLDPQTVSLLERNLALIDRAIAESRTALLGDPASRFLATQLARSYSSKLTLLRGIATLPAGT